jgi:hypothetical protein
MKAPDILAAYYSGLRPVSVPARVLPATVKVALALDRSAVAVSNVGGHFRVVAGDGMVVAHRASGAWTLVPETDGRVRIVPPADQSGASSARLLESDPTTPIVARPLALRVALDGPPAITRFVLHHPDGRSEAVGSPALRSGEVTVKVAASASLGTYRIEVERDPGGGRTTTIALTADVAVPADNAASGAELASAPARSRPPTDPAPRHPLLPILAATLLGAVAVAATRATGVSLGRTRGRPLH